MTWDFGLSLALIGLFAVIWIWAIAVSHGGIDGR